MDAVSITSLSYVYGRLPALDDLSFAVPEGEFFGIIGPNGSGKTTLLKLMAGIMAAPQDAVSIFGRPLERYSRKEIARILAIVPQLVQEDFPFDVRQIVLMGRTPHMGMLGISGDADNEITRQAMAFTETDHLADRTLDRLSGGEQQRVSIARAICQQPKIILLDEPTAALDLAHQIRIMDLMAQLKTEQKVTVVMVSHDINLAALYADRILLLKDGRRVGLGTPKEVLTAPVLEDAYGCRLLVDESPLSGVPRVNLLPAKYDQNE